MLPVELLSDVSFGFEGSQDHDNMVIGDFQFQVLLSKVIFLCNHHSLFEEVRINSNKCLLRDMHDGIRESPTTNN